LATFLDGLRRRGHQPINGIPAQIVLPPDILSSGEETIWLTGGHPRCCPSNRRVITNSAPMIFSAFYIEERSAIQRRANETAGARPK